MNRAAGAALLLAGSILSASSSAAHAQASVALPSASERMTAPAPLYDAARDRAATFVAAMMEQGVNVPLPRDPGGGFTHEQHKRNYRALYEAGQLYRLTRDPRYRAFMRDMLVAYADMYPRLGPHPARSNQQYGRLFWQNLNDCVWLVNAVQGYAAIRDDLSAADRHHIDEDLFRAHATFLSVESVRTFDRIHNHATWSTAGVGMTGMLLDDEDMVQRALLGSRRDGQSGFLRQMDLLFSPDGYYAEGPYYQRYALQPFMVFADAINRHDPSLDIFGRRDGILLKALTATIQLTYDGHFFPFNDAMKDKSLNTEELYQAIAVAYVHTGNRQLLDVATRQGVVALSPGGYRVAADIHAGMASPFTFTSLLLRDGPRGDAGAIAILRRGDDRTGMALVIKNSSQGMGHGHFDRLGWMFYDNGHELVTDYGAARFLNIEAKEGGRYLPENESWAKQSIAHNVLVVDETTHFGGDEGLAEQHPARQLAFAAGDDLSYSIGESVGAYAGVTMRRSMASVAVPGLEHPVVVDLMRASSDRPHRYDLPLHYQGHVIQVGAPLTSHVMQRPVLGAAHGYQHIWVDAEARPTAEQSFLTWQLGNRFYTWRWVPVAGAQLILGESGANDPSFNLRREPLLIQRVDNANDARFVSVLESHGRYDGAAEQTTASNSQIRSLSASEGDGFTVIIIETLAGARLAVGFANDPSPDRHHQLRVGSETIHWTGPAGRIRLSDAVPS